MAYTPFDLKTVAAELVDHWVTFQDGIRPNDLGKALREVKAPNGTFVMPSVGPVGMGQEWVGARSMTELKTGATKVTVKKYEDSMFESLEDVEDLEGLRSVASTLVGRLQESSTNHLALRPFYAMFDNIVNPQTGAPMFGAHVLRTPGKEDDEDAAIATIINDLIDADRDSDYIYLLGDDALVRGTHSLPTLQLPGIGSGYTFDTDNIRGGWRARDITVPALATAAIRTNKAFSADVLKELIYTAEGWRNQKGQRLGPNFHTLVIAGSSPNAELAKDLLGSGMLNGSTNRLAGQLKLITY